MSNPTIEVLDNSDMDLTGVPLKDPIINGRFVLSHITNLYWEALKSDKTPDGKAKQLVIELATDEPAVAEDGREVPIGQPTKVNIYATPVGGLTQDMVNKKLGRFQVAALGLSEPTRFGPPDQYIGKQVKAYYEGEDARQGGGRFQRVTRWEKA